MTSHPKQELRSVGGTLWTALLFAGSLLVSFLFTLPVMIMQQVFPNRSPHHSDRYGFQVPTRAVMVLIDIVCVVATYLLADVLRCAYWQKTAWPEKVEGVGSTLDLHIKMMVLIAVAWPLILHWLGWYKPRWRSWWWKARNTLAATVLLGLTMSALSLLLHRELYPRIQIAFVAALLPITTAAVLLIHAAIVHALHTRRADSVYSAEW
jgi:hypothetical protein